VTCIQLYNIRQKIILTYFRDTHTHTHTHTHKNCEIALFINQNKQLKIYRNPWSLFDMFVPENAVDRQWRTCFRNLKTRSLKSLKCSLSGKRLIWQITLAASGAHGAQINRVYLVIESVCINVFCNLIRLSRI